MKPLSKTLMTSAAALVIAAGGAFAQSMDTSADVDATVDTDTSVAAEAETSMEAETDAVVDETAEAIDNTAEDLEQAGEDVADAAEETADDVADAAEEAGDELTMDAEEEMTADAGADVMIDDDLAAAADLQISSLIGTEVLSEDGNSVGEIDNFVNANGEIWAVVGIGGFLGLGEHDVAITMDNLAVAEMDENGEIESFMISGYTEEELKAMEQIDAAEYEAIDGEMSLRSAING